MDTRYDLKPLFVEWLQEEFDSFGPRQEKIASVYFKALESLKVYEQLVTEPSQLLKVKGIGNSIKNKLTNRLKKHCDELNIPYPEVELPPSTSTTKTRIRTLDVSGLDESGTVKKKKRKYVPRKRSGAFAILLAMLELGSPSTGLTKEEIITVAAKYCDSSFLPNPSTREFHSAWSSIKVLIDHSLVLEQGRPRRYIITEEGVTLAETLKDTVNVSFPVDCIYNRKKQDENAVSDEQEVSANLSELMRQDRVGSVSMGATLTTAERSIASAITTPDLHASETITSSSPKRTLPRTLDRPRSQMDGVVRARWNGTSYEVWEPENYDIRLFVDHREVRSKADRDFFVSSLCARNVCSEGKVLALGDMVWVARNKETGKHCVLNFLLERKRLDDLSLSIKDNRFMEQKHRLKKTGCKHIFYLVEETSGLEIGGMEDAIRTSIWMTTIYNSFHIKRTKNVTDTVDWLTSMTDSIKKYYNNKCLLVLKPLDVCSQEDYGNMLNNFRDQFERDGSRLECCHSYESFQEVLGKTDMMTVKELYIRALMLTRGVSLEKALAIQSKYPTLYEFLVAYSKCKSEEEGRTMVYSALSEQPGSQKIGKALSETLWNTFGKK
ncbi:HGL328Cp [Eremothecium sinecaudum]|uniref:Crossover junction endonuclease MUS81 n=1 Tax=Eremothecium sinecaudum TaxID=45286 RepID=A0A0X8HUZ3_9SACH|nr:HGL328Cp [Eremothecium sinecaudum]AMD22012.1 HGL328Cp [Eremothecium sinecaudum]